MRLEDCYYLGTITKTHGYKGELNLFLDTDEPEKYKNLESIFIERNGLLVPFFLEKAQLHRNHHLRIIIEDWKEPEQLVGREVYLPLNTLPPLEGNQFYYHEVLGFEILDGKKSVGKIIGIRNGMQDLFEIKSPEEIEILIPIIDDWIKEVDRNSKKITTQLPDGLIEVFYL